MLKQHNAKLLIRRGAEYAEDNLSGSQRGAFLRKDQKKLRRMDPASKNPIRRRRNFPGFPRRRILNLAFHSSCP